MELRACTLPISLVIAGSALAVGDLVRVFSQALGYALGMGSVFLVVTLGTALFRRALSRGLDRLTSPAHRSSARFLLAAGIYPTFYWISVAGLF